MKEQEKRFEYRSEQQGGRPGGWKKNNRLQFCTVFLLLMLLLCMIPIMQGIQTLRYAKASSQWRVANGSVIAVGISENDSGDSTTYTPNVAYAYSVGSDDFVGSQIAFAAIGTVEAKAKAKIAQYPVGRAIRVYYDPADPAQSVLEPGETINSWTKIMLGVILLVFAVIVYVLLVIASKRPKTEAFS